MRGQLGAQAAEGVWQEMKMYSVAAVGLAVGLALLGTWKLETVLLADVTVFD